MKRLTPYIAISVGLHLILLPLLVAVRLNRTPQPEIPPPILLEMVSPGETPPPEPQTPEPDDPPVAERPLQKTAFLPPQAKADPSPPEPEPAEPVHSDPPRSILFEKRPTLAEVLELDNRLTDLSTYTPEPDPVDEISLIKQRVAQWTRLPAPGRGSGSAWLAIPAMAAMEGTAFYAAYRADNTYAMVAVGGISLTVGALRHSMEAIAQQVTRHRRTPEDLQPDDWEIDILERVWAAGTIDIRRLYLSLPSGWTYQTLQDALEDLVKRDILVRTGKEHRALYTAAVERAQMLQAIVAANVGGGLSPEAQNRIIRLAQIATNASPPRTQAALSR